MTPERAAEVHRQQSQFPYWGNYQKFMTEDEIAYCQHIFMNAESDHVSFASVVNCIRKGIQIPLKTDKDEQHG